MRLAHEAERDYSGENADLEDAAPEAPKKPAAEQDSHIDRVPWFNYNAKLNCACGNGFLVEGNRVDAEYVEGSLRIRVTVSIYSQEDHED